MKKIYIQQIVNVNKRTKWNIVLPCLVVSGWHSQLPILMSLDYHGVCVCCAFMCKIFQQTRWVHLMLSIASLHLHGIRWPGEPDRLFFAFFPLTEKKFQFLWTEFLSFILKSKTLSRTLTFKSISERKYLWGETGEPSLLPCYSASNDGL